MDKEQLKQFIPFAGLQEDYLEEALGLVELTIYKKGQMVFKRGREYKERFYLLAGQVDLIDSDYMVKPVFAGSELAKSPLNGDSPTHCSGVVKGADAKIVTISEEGLDRLVAWSESAESAFEAELDGKVNSSFMSDGNHIEVADVADEVSSDWMSSLLQSPLFTRVPLTHVQDLFARFEDVAVDAGEIIIKEGAKGDYFYVLARGQAHITNRSESVDVVVEPGRYFGEEALLGDTLRNATVTMLASGVVKRLMREDFLALLREPVLNYIDLEQLQGFSKKYKLIDVKMPMEFRAHHVDGCINVPLPRLRSQLTELAQSCVYIVPDDAGSRADIASYLMCQAGFDSLILRTVSAQPAAVAQ